MKTTALWLGSSTLALRWDRARRAARHIRGLLRPEGPEYALDDVHGLQDVIDRGNFERMGRRLVEQGGLALFVREAGFRDPDLRAHLASLPADTLGGAFSQFLDAHALELNIDHGADASDASALASYAKRRHRESHDLMHLLVDLGVTPREEVLVQAFTIAQNLRWGSCLIVLGGMLKHGRSHREPALLGPVLRAWRAGRRANYLLSVEWEANWETPLDELRERLGVERLGRRGDAFARAA